MTLGDFRDYIRSVLNESTDVDAFIVEELRKTAKKVEQRFNWRHMHKLETFTLTVGIPEKDLGLTIKRPEYIWMEANGKRAFYEIRDVRELSSIDDLFFYYEARILRPNFSVTQNMDFKMTCWRYSTWPTSITETLPTLAVVAEDLLFHETIVALGRILKDNEIVETHGLLAKIALEDAIAAESELMIGGRFDSVG